MSTEDDTLSLLKQIIPARTMTQITSTMSSVLYDILHSSIKPQENRLELPIATIFGVLKTNSLPCFVAVSMHC